VCATALVSTLCLVLVSSGFNGDVLVIINNRDKQPSYFYGAANVEFNVED
jgi:hypothetical protein